MKPILAIVVLYKMQLLESATYRTLYAAFAEDAAIHAAIDMVVADNSPEAQSVPDELRSRYLHDGKNPGLAAHYNFALQRAVTEHREWLLLLDQDTGLTMQYLKELVDLSRQLAGQEEIAAIVPRLVEQDRMLSPHLRPYWKSTYRLDFAPSGPIDGPVQIFNSGALVRVKALQRIGGFPETYPLDYLDHAIFGQMQKAGSIFYLMNARLEHQLSVNDPERHKSSAFAKRRVLKLAAEIRYYREFGTFKERLLHRVDLAREARQALRRGGHREAARLARAILSWPGAL